MTPEEIQAAAREKAEELVWSWRGRGTDDTAFWDTVGKERYFSCIDVQQQVPSVAAALAALMEANAVLEEHNRIVHQQLVEAEVKLNELMEENERLKAEVVQAKDIAETWLDQYESVRAKLAAAEQRAADERVKGVEYAMGFMNDKGSCSVGSITALKQYIARRKGELIEIKAKLTKAGKGESNES